MKQLLLIISICLFTCLNAQDKAMQELRPHYMTTLQDADNAPDVYEKFLEVDNPSAKVLAYKGALEAIMTRTTWNVFKKLSYLRKSEKSFEKAVELAPNDMEIRFMRMAVQFEIPEYLGFSEDLETDKAFVVKHISNFKAENFDRETCEQIFAFMKRSNYFTENQIQKFKGYLALNQNPDE
jgi:tetratricopeptide (TPR) repeat protein